MLVNSFRNIQPVNIFLLLVVIAVLRLPFFFHAEPVAVQHYTEPLSRLLFSIVENLSLNIYLNVIITMLLILLQALILNRILIKYNILFKSSYLPALMYVIVTSIFSSYFVLTPIIICNFFILVMLDCVFSLKTNYQPLRTSFDLGLYAAIISLFYFPSIILALVIWLSLVFFRSFNWREWLAAIIGMLVPYFFMGVYFFVSGDMNSFDEFWKPVSPVKGDIFSFSKTTVLIFLPFIIVFLLAVKDVVNNFYKNIIYARKSQQLLFVIILLSLVAVYLSQQLNKNHFMLCAAPLSVFLSYYFLLSKRAWIHETLLLLLLLSVIMFQIM